MSIERAVPVVSRKQRFARRALRNPSFIVGLAITVTFCLMALFGPLVAPHDPFQQHLEDKLMGPTVAHPLGYDELGRDMLSRLLYGAKYSLGLAFAVVALGLTIGLILGSLSGFYGGFLDTVIMRIMDAQLAFPGLLIAIAIVSVLGRGFGNLIIALSIGSVPSFTRLIRSSFLSLRESEFVTAAHAVGTPNGRIIGRHILPNCMAPILVQSTYMVASTILAASGLSFLGLGAQPPLPEWGVMLSRGRGYMRLAPHVVIVPGLVIAICILGLNLLGDGLRDILDPRLVE
jgi:ABC-type dipeptide/oligopeptide/nickel transport system permease subunit